MLPFAAPALDPLHWIYLFAGLLFLAGKISGRSPAAWRVFPYLSAAFFLGLYSFTATGPVAVHLGLLCLLAVLFRLARSRPLVGVVLVFAALFAYEWSRLIGMDFGAPRGYSYLLFRLYDAVVGPARPFGRVLIQVCAFSTLLAGPIILRDDARTPKRVPLERGAALLMLGLLKIHWLLPLFESCCQTGLLTPLRLSSDGLKNLWSAGAYGYARLFLDFSGYTDIVVGLAALVGLRLRHNFYQPYLACSVSDFWRRWHLTLGLWVRRHVYIPLGGSRSGRGRTLLNLFLSMMLIGLWHGLQLNFLIWGAFMGLALAIERGLGLHRRRSGFSWPRWFLTQNLLVLSWTIFFWK